MEEHESKMKKPVELIVGHRYEVGVWDGGTEKLYYIGEVFPGACGRHYAFSKTPGGEVTERVNVRDRIYREVESDENTLIHQVVTPHEDIAKYRPDVLTPEDGLQADYESLIPEVKK